MEQTILEIVAIMAVAVATHIFMRQYRTKSRARRIQEVAARLLEG